MPHTPAPWRVERLKDEYGLDTNHWHSIDCDSGTGVVAKIEGFGSQPEANARLIAAAPEMLDLLQRLLIEDQLPEHLIDQVDAVVRKAVAIPAQTS
jgi:hypothetical protein